jgi:hypothetical protein
MAPKERPPPRPDDQGDGPRIERFPGRLGNYSTPRPCPAQSIPRERLVHLARQIHPLGERPLAELFIELAAGAPLIPRLEAYARLEPLAGFIQAMDGNRLPQPRVVPGRRA